MRTLLVTVACVSLAACNCGGGGGNDGGGGGSGGSGGSNGFAWAQSFTVGPSSQIVAAAADASGVVVVGQITGTGTIGSNTLNATSSSGNGFVAKLDPSGNVLWAAIASGNQSLFEAVAIDTNGDIVVTGQDYGAGTAGTTFAGTTVNANTSDMIGSTSVTTGGGLVLRLGSGGALKWLKLVETTSIIDVGSVAIVGGKVVVAGALNGDANFGTGSSPVTGCGNLGCVVLAAYDASGNAQWAEKAPSTPQRGNGAANPREVWVTGDAAGAVVVAVSGYFEASSQSDGNQLVLNKYDTSGALTWTKSFAMPAMTGTTVGGLATDAANAIYLTGAFGQGLMLSTTVPTSGNGDWVAKFSATGDSQWVLLDDLTSATGVVATHSLAVGGKVLTFGNGGPSTDALPADAQGMVLDQIDPAAGTVSSLTQCGGSGETGRTVATSGAAIYVAGEEHTPAEFGSISLTNSGFFVAKLK